MEETKEENDMKKINMQTILTILDGYDYLDSCIVVMTANDKEKLDEALIRSGRIDFKCEIEYPSYDTINLMFKQIYKTEENLDMNIIKKLFN